MFKNLKTVVNNTFDQVHNRITQFKQTAKENKEELIRGSVLEPYNRPSSTPESVK